MTLDLRVNHLRPHRILFVLACANFLNAFDRQLVSVLAEPLRHHFNLSDLEIGWVNSAFELVYPFFAVLLAFVADRWSRHKIITLSLAVWSSATMVAGFAMRLPALLIGRAGLGVGSGGYGPSGLAILSDTFPPTQRSRVIAAHDLGMVLGSGAGAAIGGYVGYKLGWRYPFLIGAALGFILLPFIWSLRIPKRGASELKNGQSNLAKISISQLLKIVSLRYVYVANVLFMAATSAIVFWMPAFLVRQHDMNVSQAGLVAGVLQVTVAIVAIPIWGLIADKWTMRTHGGKMLALAVGYLVGTPFVVLALTTSSVVGFAIFALIASACYLAYFPCIGPQIHDVTHPDQRASALGINIMLGHLLGAMLAPPLVGWISDNTGGLTTGLIISPVLAVAGAVVVLLGVRAAIADRKKIVELLDQPLPGAE
ncbi:MAG: MFS transporter [Chloroflexota bacterium]